jgi:hypothetical protein
MHAVMQHAMQYWAAPAGQLSWLASAMPQLHFPSYSAFFDSIVMHLFSQRPTIPRAK